MIEQGHEVANHGTEDETTALLKPEVFATQFLEAHERITEKCQQPLRWYRPGRGLYKKSMLKALPQNPELRASVRVSLYAASRYL